MLKGYFSRNIPKTERVFNSRAKRRERGIWQRRFWTHLITSQQDFNAHFDYVHWNPVKHGYVHRVVDWSCSSFHRYVAEGVYDENWGHSGWFSIEIYV